jgi:hypothetical protein
VNAWGTQWFAPELRWLLMLAGMNQNSEINTELHNG